MISLIPSYKILLKHKTKSTQLCMIKLTYVIATNYFVNS